MGVFYNPAQPMPLSQIGYQTQISGASGGGGGKRTKNRDLAAEKQDAMSKASKVSDGDPNKYADTLTKLGYAEDAIAYKDKYAKSKIEELKAEELEVNQYTERLRVSADLARSGREDLAMKAMNRITPDIENQIIRLKYNSKKDSVSYETHSGESGEMGINDLIKAGTDSKTQFQEQAATKRTMLSTMKDPRQMSPTDLLGRALSKQHEIERIMGNESKTAAQVIKENPDLTIQPIEKTMVRKWKEGDLTSLVAAMTSSNPGMFDRYEAKTPEDDAKIVSKLFRGLQRALEEEETPGTNPKEGGGGPKVPFTKGGSKDTVSTSERSHPAFKKNDNGLLVFKTKDGDEVTVHPTMKDDAIKDGLTPVTE